MVLLHIPHKQRQLGALRTNCIVLGKEAVPTGKQVIQFLAKDSQPLLPLVVLPSICLDFSLRQHSIRL